MVALQPAARALQRPVARHARIGTIHLSANVPPSPPPPPPPLPPHKGRPTPPPLPPPGQVLAALVALLLAGTSQPWIRRGVRFWGGCVPIGATYTAGLLTAPRGQSRKETLEALHERCAPRALALITGLGGGYVKIGQV